MLHIHACYKHMFQVFHMYVASIFIWDVAYVLQRLQICFPGVPDVYCKCVTVSDVCYKVLHQDVAKLDLMVYILQWDPLRQPPAAAAEPACMRMGAEGA
jgi:hypothetical protein